MISPLIDKAKQQSIIDAFTKQTDKTQGTANFAINIAHHPYMLRKPRAPLNLHTDLFLCLMFGLVMLTDTDILHVFELQWGNRRRQWGNTVLRFGEEPLTV